MNTDVSINGIFTTSAQNRAYGNCAVEGSMIRWLLEVLWKDRDAALHKRHQRERDAAFERQNREHTEKEIKQQDRETTDTFMMWLISEEYRQAFQQLSNDIDDAIAVTRIAYERAEREQESARDDLNAARHQAITLADGRRVFFTADGQRLYGEDRREIGERKLLHDARAGSFPGATTFEEYIAREDRFLAATLNVQQLGEALDRLDDIRVRVSEGNLTKEDLEQLRKEQQAIVEGLPVEAQQDYARLRALRNGTRPATYRALDPETERAIDLTSHFVEADSRPTSTELAPGRPLAYTVAPD